MSEKETPTETFIREVSTWKFAGVIVWHAGLFLLGAAVWTLPASTSIRTLAAALFSTSWFYLILVFGPMVGVLYAQRRVLTTIDVPPLYVAKLGWSSKAWPALLLSRWVDWGGHGDTPLLFVANWEGCAGQGQHCCRAAGCIQCSWWLGIDRSWS